MHGRHVRRARLGANVPEQVRRQNRVLQVDGDLERARLGSVRDVFLLAAQCEQDRHKGPLRFVGGRKSRGAVS